eukprot:8465022-Lingulodinium_polyedra.AAC.1
MTHSRPQPPNSSESSMSPVLVRVAEPDGASTAPQRCRRCPAPGVGRRSWSAVTLIASDGR